jgi:luciferase family oxidoreductase group 1
MIPLSVLDLVPINEGSTASDALARSLDLARHAERFGYRRFWVAEHHNMPGIASAATSVVIGHLAGGTSTIRIGAGGIMLPNHSPMVIAEQFGTLEALYPGRIDLGLGRAPGSDGRTAFALNPNAREAADRFPAQVQEVLGWLGDGLPEGHPFLSVTASPAVPTRPEAWILGSSDYGAQVAAFFGLPYCFAHFITERGSEEAVALYRENFRAHPGVPGRLEAPRAALGVFALTADTEAEAWRLYKSRELWRLFRDGGRYPPLPSVEEAEAYPFSEAERAHLDRLRARAIVGAPEQVRAKLEALAERHGAAEVAVLTPCHDPDARQRSYRLLAEAFGLAAGGEDGRLAAA